MIKKIFTILFLITWLVYPFSYINAALNTHSVDLELGSTQFLDIADGSQTGLDLTGDHTFEAWVNLESLASDGATMCIICKWTGADRGYIWEILVDANKSTHGVWETGGANASTTTTDASVISGTGTWIHLAVSFDASVPDWAFYVDGSSVGDTTVASNATSIKNTAQPFEISARSSGTEEFFDGLIDEVRVWSDIRTSTEISNNKDIQLNGDEAGLVANYRFNNDLLDQTSNNNDLTNNNSATFSTSVPFAGTSEATGRNKSQVI